MTTPKGTLAGDLEELSERVELLKTEFLEATGLTKLYQWNRRRKSVHRLAVDYGVTSEIAGELYDEFGEFGSELVLWTAASWNVGIEEAKEIMLSGLVRLGESMRGSGLTARQAAEAITAEIRSSAGHL